MEKQRFYTAKTLEQETQFLTSEKAIFKARTIWRIASFDWKLKRVSYKRLEHAKKIYNCVRKCWKCKNNFLQFDSLCTATGEKIARYWSNKEDFYIEKLKKLCKPLKLTVVCSTWAHIYANISTSEIM